MKIDAGQLSHQELNDQLRMSREQNIIIENCLGQRYLASGSRGKKVTVTGTPGNALGSYLDGTEIDVYGNVQEATGDTMNGGLSISMAAPETPLGMPCGAGRS